MSWYVKTESKESKHHVASVTYHGPMSHYGAEVFKYGIEYVDDPTISAEVMSVHKLPRDVHIREVFQYDH